MIRIEGILVVAANLLAKLKPTGAVQTTRPSKENRTQGSLSLARSTTTKQRHRVRVLPVFA